MRRIKQKGISPVIGVILLVAVTVALISLATFIVFNIGGDVSDSSDVTLQIEQVDEGINFNIIRNQNVNDIRVNGPDEYEETFDANDIGNSQQITEGAGSYTIVAVLSDGSEETIRTINVNSEGETLSGTASINPPIEGAIITAYDSEGTILDSEETNENGEYSLTVSSLENVKRTTLSANGETEYDGNPLYASAEIMNFENDNIDFTFDSDSVKTPTVNGEKIAISNTLEVEEEPDVIPVSTLTELQAINNNLNSDYKLLNDIDASETENWNDGQGFKPIGNNDDNFIGSFDGQKYVIDGLYIDRIEDEYVGLFGVTNGDIIQDINVENANIKGNYRIGIISGWNKGGNISNTYSNGSVTIKNNNGAGGISGRNDGYIIDTYSSANIQGGERMGGIVGVNVGEVINSSASGNIQGGEIIGGLMGYNFGKITDSYATGDVDSNSERVGGLVGYNDNSGDEIYNSYATGDVNGTNNVGGLTGWNGNKVYNSYATGNVNGENNIGGLVGRNRNADIYNSFSKGDVFGDSDIGGLVGYNTISNSDYIIETYTTGDINGTNNVGGMIGYNGDENSINDSYWDVESTNINNAIGLNEGGEIVNTESLITTDMTGNNAQENMTAFDFTDTWDTVVETDNYPELQWQK